MGNKLTGIRLPEDTHAALRYWAKEHDRTLNKQIVNILRQWLVEHPLPPTPAEEADAKRFAGDPWSQWDKKGDGV